MPSTRAHCSECKQYFKDKQALAGHAPACRRRATQTERAKPSAARDVNLRQSNLFFSNTAPWLDGITSFELGSAQANSHVRAENDAALVRPAREAEATLPAHTAQVDIRVDTGEISVPCAGVQVQELIPPDAEAINACTQLPEEATHVQSETQLGPQSLLFDPNDASAPEAGRDAQDVKLVDITDELCMNELAAVMLKDLSNAQKNRIFTGMKILTAKLRSQNIPAVNPFQYTDIQTTQAYDKFVDKQVTDFLCDFHVVKIPVCSNSPEFKGIPPISCHIRDLGDTLSCAFAHYNIDTGDLQFTPQVPTCTEPKGTRDDIRVEHPLQGRFAHEAYQVCPCAKSHIMIPLPDVTCQAP